jgi:OOP family OmpA-OmpF porin
MRFTKPALLCPLLLSLSSFQLLSAEQPKADELVGEKYIGFHGISTNTDDDRLFTLDPNSSLDSASGFGAEFGYRVSADYEARLSATNFNIDAEQNSYDIADGSSIALDLLYFPYQQSFYTVIGANFLDLGKSNLSGDLGAGFRHYVSDRAALYVEGKGHYQFDDNYLDFSARIGFMYFFDKKAPQVASSQPAPAAVASVALKDDDRDGVSNPNDACPTTPITNKVDAQGCTLFLEEQIAMKLLVNFANNSADVSENYLAEIESVAQFMNTYPQTHLTINGHTSTLGEADYNQQLSEKRAQAIIDILVSNFDISAQRLTAIGHGETKPLNTAKTIAAHQTNRRIEARIKAVKKVAELK